MHDIHVFETNVSDLIRIFNFVKYMFNQSSQIMSNPYIKLMKKIHLKSSALTILFFLFVLILSAQPTNCITDAELRFKEAKDLFSREMYALSYPLLKELKNKYPDSKRTDHAYLNDEIDYYYIVTELKMMHSVGEPDAVNFINRNKNQTRRQLMSFHLAHYYFLTEDYPHCIEYYEKAGKANLTNNEIANAKFEKAYAYFNEKKFSSAEPLFKEIVQIKDSKYHQDAVYYHGYISYFNKDYEEALNSFKQVDHQSPYDELVPYYITEILYFQGKKDEALDYGSAALKAGKKIFYEKDLKRLLGQIYFEKSDFAAALPLLEEYAANGEKISKAVQYQLSYCYYRNNENQKAIEGFRQLSSEKDSLGQNSMYLLGSLYLKAKDKSNARNAFQYSAYNGSNNTLQRISRFHYAKLSYDLGFQDIAQKELQQYLNDYPNSEYDTEAKELLVGILANTSNFVDGLALYNSFSYPTATMQKAYPRLLYGRAIELINDQQLIAADELLTIIINKTNPENLLPYVHFWRGEIANRQQRYDDAARHMNTFIQGNVTARGEANFSSAKYNLGYALFQLKDYKGALPNFEAITKTLTSTSTPLEQEAFIRAADCYYMLKDFPKASSMYDLVVTNSLSQADYALYQKAMILGVKNSNDKIKLLTFLSRQYPQSTLLTQADMEIALTYIDDEKFSDAIPYLNKIITSDDAVGLKPKAYSKLGLAYFNSNDNKNALIAYNQLLDKYPQSSETDEAVSTIKEIYMEDGKPDEYVDLVRSRGIAVAVSDADSLSYHSAYLKYQSGDCALAVPGFSNYLNRYPNGGYVIEANYYTGLCYQKSKDWQAAAKALDYVYTKGVSKLYEPATLELARIYYFELKDYAGAKKYFESMRTNAVNPNNRLEALRGLVRTYYQLKDYSIANDAANELLTQKSISTDDKLIASLVLGKSQQLNNDCASAIASFKVVSSANKSSWGAEARYETAVCHFLSNNLSASEKAAMSVIKETGSYDYWVTKSYILLGDIFMKQKDYFNAKATYESVAKNSSASELKEEAQKKYDAAVVAEKK